LSETKIYIPTKDISLDKDKRPDRYAVRTIVINALRKGHNKIRITFDSPKILPVINSCVDEVLGYEISEQGSNGCVIENVVKLIEGDIEKYSAKFRHVVSNFAHIVRDNIINNSDNYEETKSAFITVEKSYNTFCRFLMNDIEINAKEKIFLYTSFEYVYQAARNLFYVSKLVKNHPLKTRAVFNVLRNL